MSKMERVQKKTKTKENEKINLNLNISVIPLKVNSLNTTIKRQVTMLYIWN